MILNEWLQVSDNVYSYELVKNGHAQRYIFDANEGQYFYEFKDEGPIELEQEEVPGHLMDELEKILKG